MNERPFVQQQDGQRQSQWQGQRPAEPTPHTTADPGADGQNVFDLQDDELRERGVVRPDPRRTLPPDSNAI